MLDDVLPSYEISFNPTIVAKIDEGGQDFPKAALVRINDVKRGKCCIVEEFNGRLYIRDVDMDQDKLAMTSEEYVRRYGYDYS